MKRALLPSVAVVLLALPASAGASAAATITACKGDKMTVAGKVAATGNLASKVRGAKLQMRFRAMPLFALPRSADWRDLGKKKSASSSQDFTGLGAENWIGVMNWRFLKGRKAVASGTERSQPVRIGASKGRANCTLALGAKPIDSTPPAQFIVPADEAWHRAPAPVQLLAKDDFSGVANVKYSLDGGQATDLRNGSTFSIPSEGAHNVQWSATDVAGNTATRTDVVRVDAAPPSKPALSRPFSVTSSTTPLFQWSASTDSGSGLKGYFLSIKRADGSLVALQPYSATTTSANSPVPLTDGETYTAVVTAVDNTDTAWTSDSDPLTFRVDTSPQVNSVDPADGTVLAGSLKDGNFVLSLDRPVDPATVTQGNVVLDRSADSGSDPAYALSCNSPCTTITVNPNSQLAEGRYALSVGGLKSEEGVTLAGFTAHYAVPFMEGGSLSAQSTGIGPACAAGNNPTSTFAITSASGETGELDFDWTASSSGVWTVQAQYGGSGAGGSDTASGSGASGHAHLGPFTIHSSGVLTFKLTVACPATTVNLTNMLGTRVP